MDTDHYQHQQQHQQQQHPHPQDAMSVYVELSAAIESFKARGLAQSVKWAAEQLVGLPREVWEAGAAAAAQHAGATAQPESPKLVQGRCLFELKVGVLRLGGWWLAAVVCACGPCPSVPRARPPGAEQ
jgi:hypothetical protein